MYLLDANVLIDIQRGYGPAVEWFRALAVGRPATPCTFNPKHYRVVPDLVTEQP